jgi:hypothetical protein
VRLVVQASATGVCVWAVHWIGRRVRQAKQEILYVDRQDENGHLAQAPKRATRIESPE